MRFVKPALELWGKQVRCFKAKWISFIYSTNFSSVVIYFNIINLFFIKKVNWMYTIINAKKTNWTSSKILWSVTRSHANGGAVFHIEERIKSNTNCLDNLKITRSSQSWNGRKWWSLNPELRVRLNIRMFAVVVLRNVEQPYTSCTVCARTLKYSQEFRRLVSWKGESYLC